MPRSSTTTKRGGTRRVAKKAPAKKAVRKKASTKAKKTTGTKVSINRIAKKILPTGTVKRNPLGHLLMEKMFREAGFRGGISSDKKLLDAYSTDESIFSIRLTAILFITSIRISWVF